MRFCLFHAVSVERVWTAVSAYYSSKNTRLAEDGDDYHKFDLHQRDGEWVVLNIGNPPAFEAWWMDAQRKTSEMLWCKSFLLFVYDGDYWGYQLFKHGEVLDRFVQSNEHNPPWFPNRAEATGDPSLLTREFPWLTESEVAPYLIKMPELGSEDFRQIMSRLDVRVRPEDGFTRFDECSVLNFMRLLRVRAELQEVKQGARTFFKVAFLAPEWRTFWIAGREQNYSSSSSCS